MITKNKEMYEAPQVEIVEVCVEQGFAVTGGNFFPTFTGEGGDWC